MKLLYYMPLAYGGIADYAHEQANALSELGVDVDFLTSVDFDRGKERKYRIIPKLFSNNEQKNALLSKLTTTLTLIANHLILAHHIKANGYRCILFGSFAEYLAPIWFFLFKRMKIHRVKFAAVVHDPVRDYVVGPLWWHQKSIAAAYSFLDYAYVHYPIELNTYDEFLDLKTEVIPFAAYSSFSPRLEGRGAIREELGIPVEAVVLLAFGHVRDNKNLDLVISAIECHESLYLIVAGKELGHGQKGFSYYQNLAKKIGVGGRCRWINEFISEDMVAVLHNACDLVVLTYSESFRSASASLNTAIHFRKPCIASAGESNLKYVVNKYKLGIWVEPDDEKAIRDGLLLWMNSLFEPQFDKYYEENSWENNAGIIARDLMLIES